VLAVTAVAIATSYGKASIFDAGPQGFSETLFAYTSQANNNGSAFAGYTGVTFADLLGGVSMLLGRFLPMIVALAVGGALVGKRVTPAGLGTMRTDTPVFVVLLVGTIVLVALLTFVPALLLGPIVQSMTGRLF
jgi:K+-transporting ATPase ATPase A chain